MSLTTAGPLRPGISASGNTRLTKTYWVFRSKALRHEQHLASLPSACDAQRRQNPRRKGAADRPADPLWIATRLYAFVNPVGLTATWSEITITEGRTSGPPHEQHACGSADTPPHSVHVSETGNCTKLQPGAWPFQSRAWPLIPKGPKSRGWPPLDLAPVRSGKTPRVATPRAWQMVPVSTTPHVKSVPPLFQSFNVARFGELHRCPYPKPARFSAALRTPHPAAIIVGLCAGKLTKYKQHATVESIEYKGG